MEEMQDILRRFRSLEDRPSFQIIAYRNEHQKRFPALLLTQEAGQAIIDSQTPKKDYLRYVSSKGWSEHAADFKDWCRDMKRAGYQIRFQFI